jgi:hypothetical protein
MALQEPVLVLGAGWAAVQSLRSTYCRPSINRLTRSTASSLRM